MKWIMVMHHFSSNIGPKRLQSQQSPVMVVGVSLVILNTDNSILVETEFWNRLPVNEKYINIFFIVFLVLWDRYFLFVCMMMLCKLNYQGRYQPSSIKGLNHTYDISFIELMRFLKKVVIRWKMWSDRSHSKTKRYHGEQEKQYCSIVLFLSISWRITIDEIVCSFERTKLRF